MFAMDSAELSPLVYGRLRQVEKLRDQYPGRMLLVVGHADRTGEEGKDREAGAYHNLQISEERAANAAVWLAEQGLWPRDRIVAEGAGSRLPLIDAPGDMPLNRRVELGLQCQRS
jgi:outer membrane protein OmpA-like peptidoglycan-associated protein